MSQDELIQVVNDKQYEDFGYLIIRTAYGDDAAYEKWSEEFGSLIEKSVVQRGEAMEEMLNKLMTAMVAEPVLHRASWKKIQEFFEEAEEDNMVPPGLDVGFCLAVDQAAMDSALKPKDGEDAWVWAVDTEFDFDAAKDQEGGEDAYPGYFKVAISSLITDFYPVIAAEKMSGAELWTLAKPVWKAAALVRDGGGQ